MNADFFNKLNELDIFQENLMNYIKEINYLISIKENLLENNIHPFLKKKDCYNQFLTYLKIYDDIYILIKIDKFPNYYVINITKEIIYETLIKVNEGYEESHKNKIKSRERLNKIELERIISSYLNSKYIKGVDYVSDKTSIYYNQNRLIIYIPILKNNYGIILNGFRNKNVRFKFLLPLNIDIKENKCYIDVMTMFPIYKDNKYNIMI